MLKRYELKNYDFKLIIMILALSILGILVIGSAQESVQAKQIMGLIGGCVFLVAASLVDYHFILNFYWILYILNISLLLFCEIAGKKVGGATRWVIIFGIQFQPSELAKILLILFYAQFIMKYKEQLNTPKILLSLVLLLLPPLYLILEQPDLSTSIVVIILFCVLIFIGGLSYKIIGAVIALIIPLTVIFINLILQPGQKLLNSYQQTRVLAWLNPQKYALAEAYQQTNSVIAIGSGMLFGKGLNNNVVGSVKNGKFISEPQTDFIFAIVGEELGFVGTSVIIILLFLIALECILIGRKAKDLSGTLICTGMAAIIGFQSFINIGVATGVLPNTGIPLPFVSYGLTSLVSLFIGMGIVLNISLQQKKY